jgi:hypothetical protein
MKNKWISRTWNVGWLLYVLTNLLPFVGYYGVGEDDHCMRDLGTLMLWGWYGAFPLIGFSLISPILTILFWKQLDGREKLNGLLLPVFLFLGCCVTLLVMALIFSI